MEGISTKWLKFIDCTEPKKSKRGKIIGYPKTQTFYVTNKESGFLLGWIKWYGPFRQYSFFPQLNTVLEKTCMNDISKFLLDLMEEHKKLKAVSKS